VAPGTDRGSRDCVRVDPELGVREVLGEQAVQHFGTTRTES
jgi:hypothetical protein